jgi:hypothetical protein
MEIPTTYNMQYKTKSGGTRKTVIEQAHKQQVIVNMLMNDQVP